MFSPCAVVAHRAVADVTLRLGYTHPSVGTRLGGTRVVGELAVSAVEVSWTSAPWLCGERNHTQMSENTAVKTELKVFKHKSRVFWYIFKEISQEISDSITLLTGVKSEFQLLLKRFKFSFTLNCPGNIDVLRTLILFFENSMWETKPLQHANTEGNKSSFVFKEFVKPPCK